MSEVLKYRYNGEDIPYTIEVSNRSRKVRIVADSTLGIRLVVPNNSNNALNFRFFESKIDWVFGEWKRIEQVQKKQSKYLLPLLEKNSIMYLGKEYQLVIDVGKKINPPVSIEDEVLVVRCVLPELAEGILTRWFRRQARAVIAGALEVYRSKMELEYNSLTIKDQKTRWGSCSSAGNLNFSWRLVMAPKPVLDYVVVHELAHIVQMNHSSKFWDLVISIMPDYKLQLNWLKENGVGLRL